MIVCNINNFKRHNNIVASTRVYKHCYQIMCYWIQSCPNFAFFSSWYYKLSQCTEINILRNRATPTVVCAENTFIISLTINIYMQYVLLTNLHIYTTVQLECSEKLKQRNEAAELVRVKTVFWLLLGVIHLKMFSTWKNGELFWISVIRFEFVDWEIKFCRSL